MQKSVEWIFYRKFTLNSYSMVEMPESKITINSSNKSGIPYVYYTKRAYRNSKGQPTSEKVLIGKKNLENGLLVPNKNYYDIFNQDEILYTKSIQDFGNYEDLEWGYNRDKEKLPQINLGMYFGETSRLPVYYCTYPGSILDNPVRIQ